MSFLLCFLKETETTGSESSSEFTDAQRENSSRGSASRDYCCCAGDACWAHIFSSEGLVGGIVRSGTSISRRSTPASRLASYTRRGPSTRCRFHYAPSARDRPTDTCTRAPQAL